MIYPQDFEQKIGFTPLRELLKENCLSHAGRLEVDALSFLADAAKVQLRLEETNEMLQALGSGTDMPTDGLHDISPSLKRARTEGSFITGEDFSKLRGFLQTLIDIRTFFARFAPDSEAPLYPRLAQRFENIPCLASLIQQIDKTVDKYGEVKDNASPTLFDLRRNLSAAKASMSSVMRRVIADAVAKGIIDKDTTPTLRDGRLVIPVAATEKRNIPGIVHDESATGKTSYIEPVQVVNASNRIRELELEIHREVVAILTALTALVRPNIDDILYGVKLAAQFDFIRSKAILASKTGGQLPKVDKTPGIEWFNAFHPALFLTLTSQGRKIVPLSLRLDKNHRFLVISGPNAGGKSVALKTVGIVQYMAQCGLLPTMDSNSRLGIFSNIFIDIGDEQSIENDLSTYSSHLRNMKFFLQNAVRSTLILADEIGSGTEPQIGGALAQSILHRLNDSKCFGVVTTHYQNIKKFAETEEGFLNGAMLYDRQHLRPLFQLSVGNPGSSFALEIARNIGLPKDVIDLAKEIVGEDYVNLDKYLLDIARDRKYWAEKRLKIRQLEAKLETLQSEHEKRTATLREQRNAILHEAREEAREILSRSNAAIENTIAEIRRAVAEKERTKSLRKELEEYKQKVSQQDTDQKVPEILRVRKPKGKKIPGGAEVPDKPEAIKVGDYVRMSSGGMSGKVLSIQGKNAEVAFGTLRTRMDISKLQKASAPKTTATSQPVLGSVSDSSRDRRLTFKRELDVRGMRVDEALQAVTYYIDDALQFEADRVRILHGTGTGALRVAIRQLLAANKAVSRFHDEDVRFGGAGITVVEL